MVDEKLVESLVKLRLERDRLEREADEAEKAASDAIKRRNRTRKSHKAALAQWLDAVEKIDAETYNKVIAEAFKRGGRL